MVSKMLMYACMGYPFGPTKYDILSVCIAQAGRIEVAVGLEFICFG